MHSVSSLQAGHANCVWRRAKERADHARWRTARRLRRRRGQTVRWTCRKIVDQALEEAGIDRKAVYVTNAVKHFKWEPRGKRRIHKKPNSREIAACRPWLEAELRLVKPKLLVCLGATAAQAIFGPSFRVTRERGKVLSSKFAPRVLATVHPSSLLRQPDEESRKREYESFVIDLRAALDAASEE
jgi:uracil-DNA glycosylase family protein